MLTSTALLVLSSWTLASPQDWPGWRGPNGDGSSAATELPGRFSREQGVRWSAELPGPSAATPVVVGERVFVTAAVEDAGVLLALCFDRASGELRWEDEAGSGYKPGGEGTQTRRDPRSDYASPSPVSDGERVVFLYGNGDLVAYDLDGERLWARNLQRDHGDFAFQWTFGASPTLWKGRLYLPVLQRDQPTDGAAVEKPIASFVLALDARDGNLVFKHERASPARMESRESYATAIVHEPAGSRAQLLVVGGDVLTSHDPESGAELWRWGTWNEGHRESWWRLVPSPVVAADRVLVCAPKKAPAYALRLDALAGGNGEREAERLLWKSGGRANPISSDVPTPLHLEGRFFVLSDVERKLSRVDPATGKAEWTIELPDRSPWEASPTGADGKVFCLSHSGLALVVDAKTGEILCQARMAEEDADSIRSSIAIAHGSLFVRTNDVLYCIGS